MYTFPILWHTASNYEAENAAAALIYISRPRMCMIHIRAVDTAVAWLGSPVNPFIFKADIY